MAAAALFCLWTGSTPAQDATPPAAPAAPGPVNAVLDSGTRIIRLDALGAQAAIPKSIAIGEFRSFPNAFSLSGDFGGASNVMRLIVNFVDGTACASWTSGSPGYDSRWVTAEQGTAPFDSRWHPKYQQHSSGKIVFCMDRPGGAISVETTPMNAKAAQPIREFTSNLADAFVPRPADASATVAEAAAGPHSWIDISGDIPTFITMAGIYCDEGRQVQCEAKANYLNWHRQCQEGNAALCSMIGRMSATNEEYAISAKFYSRACELGDSDACKKAKQSQSKVKTKN
jgi:hypothetical protein